jgi:hypothetical protein
MRYRAAAWSYTCPCASCTPQREAHLARQRGPRTPRPGDADEIAVDRAISGSPPARLNRAERIEVTRRLTARGVPAREIARVIRKTDRTVVRYRTELRMESA